LSAFLIKQGVRVSAIILTLPDCFEHIDSRFTTYVPRPHSTSNVQCLTFNGFNDFNEKQSTNNSLAPSIKNPAPRTRDYRTTGRQTTDALATNKPPSLKLRRARQTTTIHDQRPKRATSHIQQHPEPRTQNPEPSTKQRAAVSYAAEIGIKKPA